MSSANKGLDVVSKIIVENNILDLFSRNKRVVKNGVHSVKAGNAVGFEIEEIAAEIVRKLKEEAHILLKDKDNYSSHNPNKEKFYRNQGFKAGSVLKDLTHEEKVEAMEFLNGVLSEIEKSIEKDKSVESKKTKVKDSINKTGDQKTAWEKFRGVFNGK